MPRVREHHVEGMQHLGPSAEDQPRELRPVHLGLRSGRGLDPPSCPDRRRWVLLGDKSLHAAQRSAIAVLTDKPLVQRRHVQRSLAPGTHPVSNRFLVRRSAANLPGPPVARLRRNPSQVVAHSTLAERQLSGNGALGQSLAGQCLDRHADLLVGDRHVRLRNRCRGGRDYFPDPKMRKSGCRLSSRLACRLTPVCAPAR